MNTDKTSEVLATAFAAYRINKGYFSDTRRFSEEQPTLFSNKDMMLYNMSKDGQYIPHDFVKFKVTDEDRAIVKEAVAFVNKENTLKALANKLSDYMKNLIALMNSKELRADEFGIVAVLPKIYFEGKDKKDIKAKLKNEFTESRHIGTIGETIVGDFKVHEVKWVEKFSCHVLNGSMENSLVSFFKNFEAGKEPPKAGSTVKLKGKIKRHGENFITKFPETVLNYVRIF